jgi:hypothetical protein
MPLQTGGWPDLNDQAVHSGCRWASRSHSQHGARLPEAIPIAPARSDSGSGHLQPPTQVRGVLPHSGAERHGHEEGTIVSQGSWNFYLGAETWLPSVVVPHLLQALSSQGASRLHTMAIGVTGETRPADSDLLPHVDPFVDSEEHLNLARLHESASSNGDPARLMQRSGAWLRAREGRLTASNAAAAAGILPAYAMPAD